jgi:nucleotidyltransferase/DNA polymerase involved in DNA repair
MYTLVNTLNSNSIGNCKPVVTEVNSYKLVSMTETDDPISAIPNLGPATEEQMARAGITKATQLREMGADAAYSQMLAVGVRPHFIGYYVLVMSLQGRPWNDCKGEEKKALRKRFDALKGQSFDSGKADFEAIMDVIGVGTKR